jgi:hypothetical protein
MKYPLQDTAYFVVQRLVHGIELETILTDFKDVYFETVSNASQDDLEAVVDLYADMEDEILTKREKFLQSCDYSPSEGLEEMWNQETVDFYIDMVYTYLNNNNL